MRNRFDELDDVLRDLRQQHQSVGPPPHLEARLRAATRSAHRRAPIWRWGWAAAGALAIAVVVWRTERPLPTIDSTIRQASQVKPLETASPRSTGTPDRMTGFVALPGSEALPPSMETSILRVQLPKGDLRRYGFDIPAPLAAEWIRADFVVGDDGLARAIRLVR